MGISFESIILILVLALILFGPEKLPEFAEKIGRWVAKLRQASTDMARQYHQVVNPLPPPMPLSSPETLCPHCSQKLDPNFHFCPSCGRDREDFPTAPAPEPFPAAADKSCPVCHRRLEEDFLFCPTCGQQRQGAHHYPASATPRPPKVVTCLQCNRKLDSGFLFCPGCGYPLEPPLAVPKSLAP